MTMVRVPPYSLVELGEAGANCARCPLRENVLDNVRPFEPSGWTPGGLLFVGEGPGRQELAEGLPFVGPSGRLLRALAKAAGIDLAKVWVTNATLCYPVGGALEGNLTPATYACHGRLRSEIARARPGVVVAFGTAALLALVGREVERAVRVERPCALCGDGERDKKCPECGGRKTQVVSVTTLDVEHRISHVAGGVFDASMLPAWLVEAGVRYVVPTFHPAFVLRPAKTDSEARVGGPFVAPTVVQHLRKAARLLERPAQWHLEVLVSDVLEDVLAYTAEDTVYAVDIETDAKQPFDVTTIRCVGIAREGTDEALVVDTSGLLADDPVIEALRAFLANPRKKKVFQNRQYDELVFQLIWGVVTEGTIFDTMLAQHALAPDEPKDLQRIALTYTESPPWKPPKNRNGLEAFDSNEEFWRYNARDAYNTLRSYQTMQRVLAEERLERVHACDLRLATIAMEMQRTGLPLDVERKRKLGEEHTRQRDEALEAMRAAVAPFRATQAAWNPNSAQDVVWALFDPRGPCRLSPRVWTPTGAPSTSADALRALPPNEFVKALLAYREHAKLVSTYVESEGLRVGPDGRLHPAWRVDGTVTGRWSSSPNFQNWPVEARAMIGGVPGFVIVGADYSQLELRIIAALAGDATLIRLCLEADENDKTNPKKDPHSYVAALAFGRAFLESDTKGRKLLRDATKSVVYGMNYGAGAAKILETIQSKGEYKGPPLTLAMVQSIINAYFKAFEGVRRYRDEALRKAEEQRAVYSPLLGRRRPYPLGGVEATVAANYPIQSCAADLMNEALNLLSRRLDEADSQAVLLAQVHDAVYVECREQCAPRVAALVEECMRRRLRLVSGAPEMEFVATAKVGRYWDEVS